MVKITVPTTLSVANYSSNALTAYWARPTANWSGVNLRRNTGSAPANRDAGTSVYSGVGNMGIVVNASTNVNGYTNTGLTASTTYYYSIFSYLNINGTTYWSTTYRTGAATAINYVGLITTITGAQNWSIPAGWRSIQVFCVGGGGGAGAAGPGGDSQILNTQNNNDATQDEFGNYERAGDGGPGVVSDITGVAISYGDGGGGGVRRSNFKHGGLGGLGNGGRGAGLYDGTFTHATEPTPNCGGGGGGAGWNAGGSSFLSTPGADGVVILLVSKLDTAEEVNDNRTSAHAFGGNVSSIEEKEANTTYFIHEFRGSGQLEINSPVKAELLLVGGGGAGGAPTGGGGGAGGLIHIDTILLPKGIYDVTVGAGGDTNGENGGDTVLVNADESIKLVAFGGGGGGNYRNGNKNIQIGKDGGSGGGGSSNALGGEALLDPQGNPQGNNGGSGVLNVANAYTAGGGGGAGSAGTSATAGSDISCIGDGGDGLAFDITGELRYYAGGGGAGFSSNVGANGAKGLGGSGVGGDGECAFTSFRRLRGHNGLDGTGSGGGGGGRSASSTVTGGFGGTGVFILRYGVISGPTYIIIR